MAQIVQGGRYLLPRRKTKKPFFSVSKAFEFGTDLVYTNNFVEGLEKNFDVLEKDIKDIKEKLSLTWETDNLKDVGNCTCANGSGASIEDCPMCKENYSKDKMVLSTDYEFDFSFLYKLSEENLFTLGAILHHELLPPENHSLIFNQNIDKSRLQLENLAGEGLLIITGYGYQIHPFIYRPLVQTLKKMNILT